MDDRMNLCVLLWHWPFDSATGKHRQQQQRSKSINLKLIFSIGANCWNTKRAMVLFFFICPFQDYSGYVRNVCNQKCHKAPPSWTFSFIFFSVAHFWHYSQGVIKTFSLPSLTFIRFYLCPSYFYHKDKNRHFGKIIFIFLLFNDIFYSDKCNFMKIYIDVYLQNTLSLFQELVTGMELSINSPRAYILDFPQHQTERIQIMIRIGSLTFRSNKRIWMPNECKSLKRENRPLTDGTSGFWHHDWKQCTSLHVYYSFKCQKYANPS